MTMHFKPEIKRYVVFRELLIEEKTTAAADNSDGNGSSFYRTESLESVH